METLDELTQRLRDAYPSNEPPAALTRETAALARIAHAHRTQRRTIFSGVAASILVAICVLGWLTLRGSRVAFADVVARVGATSTLVADMVKEENGARARTSVVYAKGSGLRTEFAGGDGLVNVADAATGEHLELNTASRFAVRRRSASDPFNLISWLRNVRNVATTPLGVKEFDGKRLAGLTGVIERTLRDGTVERGGKFVVWVDPETKLPQRLIGLDYEGREWPERVENIRFDVPLDDSLFSTEPPAGYAVRDERGPTLAQLRPPATTQEAAHYTLKPGWGVGEVPFRATRDRIVSAFAQPETTVKDDPKPGWTKLEYAARGMTLLLGPEGGLRSVNAYNSVRGGKVAHHFPGKTDRGIGINATGEELESAYGPPDITSPSRKAENRFVQYTRLGMTASLGTGTITSITVTLVGGRGIELPISDETKRRAEAVVLKPGIGLDQLKLGATRDEVIAIFGQPEDPAAGDPQYPAIGMSFNLDKEGRLREIWGSVPRNLGNDGNPFFGKTDRGIRIGSTRADVEAAYGKADEVEEPPAKALENVASSEMIVYLNYNTLGLMVGLKGGLVTSLCVQGPTQSPQSPLTTP